MDLGGPIIRSISQTAWAEAHPTYLLQEYDAVRKPQNMRLIVVLSPDPRLREDMFYIRGYYMLYFFVTF